MSAEACRATIWRGTENAGRCGEPAYGPSIPGRSSNGWCLFACPEHGGPTVLYELDGNAWCANLDTFVNLAESPAGFGETKEEALTALERVLELGTRHGS